MHRKTRRRPVGGRSPDRPAVDHSPGDHHGAKRKHRGSPAHPCPITGPPWRPKPAAGPAQTRQAQHRSIGGATLGRHAGLHSSRPSPGRRGQTGSPPAGRRHAERPGHRRGRSTAAPNLAPATGRKQNRRGRAPSSRAGSPAGRRAMHDHDHHGAAGPDRRRAAAGTASRHRRHSRGRAHRRPAGRSLTYRNDRNSKQ